MGRRGSTPIDYQMRTAVLENWSEHKDKHSYKAQHGTKMTQDFFGSKSVDGTLDTVKNLCNYLKTTYTGEDKVKLVRDLKPEHINGWLEYRSNTCTDNTLYKYSNDIKKIELCLNSFYPSCNLQLHKNIVIPESKLVAPSASKGVENQMSISEYNKIQENGLKSKSQAYTALQVTFESGLRVEEVSKLKVSDLDKDFTKICSGYKDMKHGKALQEDKLLSKDLSEKLKKLAENKSPNQKIFDIKCGSMQRQMNRVSKMLGFESNRCFHNCRSLYGQMIYDKARSQGLSEKEALLKASKSLNHESVRSMLKESYIKTH